MGQEGCDEELGIGELRDRLQAGKVTDETLCFSSDPGFGFEGWTAWGECKERFSVPSTKAEAEPEPEADAEPEPELEPEPEPQEPDSAGADEDAEEGGEEDEDEDEEGEAEAAPGGGAAKPKVGGPTGVKNNRKKKTAGDGDAGGIPKKKKKKNKPPMGDGSGGSGIPAKPNKPDKRKKKKAYGMAEGANLVMVENPDESSTSDVIYTLEQLQDKVSLPHWTLVSLPFIASYKAHEFLWGQGVVGEGGCRHG